MKKGSGLTEHGIDYEKKIISIDFTGNRDGQCFRNDPSIFFFVANSYRKSFYTISEHIEELFNDKANRKDIEHLVLPYFFSFRHYLELELKAIISSITNEITADTHSLKDLLQRLEDALNSISENEETYKLFQNNFQANKTKALKDFTEIRRLIERFLIIEPSVEYYRYLFKKKMTLDNPILTLDFCEQDKLFKLIVQKIHRFNILLRDMDVYVYFTL